MEQRELGQTTETEQSRKRLSGRRVKRTTWMLTAVLLPTVCYALTIGPRSKKKPITTTLDASGSAVRTSAAQAAVPVSAGEVELVTINRTGFWPNQLNLHKTHFLLAVNNRSEVETVTLQLDRVAGPRLQAVAVPREKLDWRSVVDLTPGQYVLSEAAHPDWRCQINVSPH